ncbi:MAG: hypothetical protein ACRDWG_13745 [Actinomycetes bacterium]|nr:hypothetical protein [Actinomycetes bacterium]
MAAHSGGQVVVRHANEEFRLFLNALVGALDDLPDEAQRELLADFDPDVAAQFATAGEYAYELRAAAGYPPRDASGPALDRRVKGSKLFRFVRALGPHH